VNKSPLRPWRSALLLLAGLVALSVVAIEPRTSKEEVSAGPDGTFIANGGESSDAEEASVGEASEGSGTGTDAAGGSRTGTAGTKKSTGTGTGKTGTQTTGNLECKAGRNGGATDKGVSSGRISLAATNVRSGTGSSFLGTAYIGMQAVVNRVNGAGGICGRLLDLRLVDDGWNASTGAGYLDTFSKGNYFALPVVPSSEGLTQAIDSKIISGAQIPVVGSDGMLKQQYTDAWVWPVATATVTTMRVMAKHAADSGYKSFGIIYDQQYKFGVEGAKAFREYAKQLPGITLKADVGITPGKGSYAGDAKTFNDDCEKGGAAGCDFVAMLLTPETAATYISSQSTGLGGNSDRKKGFGLQLTGGAQPLFNERFARDCAKYCDGMYVWTGYNPPIGRLASEKDIAAYVDDVQSVDPSVDVSNQFLQGAYLGMKVFVHALQQVGPKLTRTAVRDAMNSLTYNTDLASTLTWGPKVPEQRFANLNAQAFRITTASGSFIGFAETDTGFRRDPTPGVIND
jgi:ABC-type branched-subunit amino acid transport system substrate-binding protein